MRKAFIQAAVMLLSAILTMGCTSDHLDQIEDQSQEEILVTFKVSPLSVTTEEIPGTGTRATISGASTGEVVKEIGYQIYKDESLFKSGVVKFDPETEEAPEDFGTLKEKLLSGTYDLRFYAFGVTSDYVSWGSETSRNIYLMSPNVELFTSRLNDYIITSNTTDIEVELQRRSALLSINISDDPLPEVDYVSYIVYSNFTYHTYYVGDNNTNTIQTNTYKVYVKDGKLPVKDIYICNPLQDKSKLIIEVYGKDGEILASQEIATPLYPNRRTIVSGNLFANLGDKPLIVTINDSWGDDVNISLK